MDLERERGITIKAHPVTMRYKAKAGETYELNLIDTPGHVDFSYEVSRSLSACEGALLIVDAAQGVEAQTVANVHLAQKQELTILPGHQQDRSAERRRCRGEDASWRTSSRFPADDAISASAKEGIGIEEILEAIITRIPPPKPPADSRCRRWCSIPISTRTAACDLRARRFGDDGRRARNHD